MKLGTDSARLANGPEVAAQPNSRHDDSPASTPDYVDHLSYLTDMVAELATMAKGARLGRLATILELAQDEAERQLESARENSAAR